jgi:hypothetical protein
MSALPPIATKLRTSPKVGFVPKPDPGDALWSRPYFGNLQ